ncbi:hypothetical protein [Segniliparus rugosus]|uniref:SnoaL-like domain-containing protein n=1 Tax=Segniliparus rugosus (strain ATCC BAA-974 / DSM 45345 / CCUG 50838 / CIP 108380 / JCM 13579 / CDC 945) TaxID=679197 RepID=E5XNL6_SEGRC|nr:hypothetical protein [Segniliparus rugosus]EFV14054.2 hypothetical protein HMPREF9336_01087 [Segniliparus rugosus ATCC BAA-974]
MMRPLFAALLVASALPAAQTLPAAADPNGSMVSCSASLPAEPQPNSDVAAEARDFAQTWFDDLSRHASANEMLSYLNLHSLVMSFPDPTSATPASVCDEASFRQWYDAAGARYAGQRYEILSFDAGGTDDQPIVHLSVDWSGTDSQTGQPFHYTVSQAWSLARGGPHGFVIEMYLVRDLAPA